MNKSYLIGSGLILLLFIALFAWTPSFQSPSTVIEITLTPQGIAPLLSEMMLYQLASPNVKIQVSTHRVQVLAFTPKERIQENLTRDNIRGAFVKHTVAITITNATGTVLYSKAINFTSGSEHTITIVGDPSSIKEGTSVNIKVDVSITVRTPSGQTIGRDKSVSFNLPVDASIHKDTA